MTSKPRENWYQLLLSMLYQKKQYAEAANVLESMVAFWPEKSSTGSSCPASISR